MKKLFAIALAFVLTCTLAACGCQAQESTPTTAPTTISTTAPTTMATEPSTSMPMDPTVETNIPDSSVDMNSTDPTDDTTENTTEDTTEMTGENSRSSRMRAR